jgi:hypothetical protein
MSDIRRRIGQRHSIDLSNSQIQELAARRLESILDPRVIKPALLDQLRRSAGTPATPPIPGQGKEPPFVFEAQTLYESHRGLLRFVRRLLNPILKLFFNPNPLIHALNAQAKLNAAAQARETERDQRQAEWNALHYEILQRLVTETSRLSLELQNASLQVESLAAKVDFNERRVRNLEGTAQPQPKVVPQRQTDVPSPAGAATPESPAGEQAGEQSAEAGRRRRRRRRGRRGGPGGTEAVAATAAGVLPRSETQQAAASPLPDLPEPLLASDEEEDAGPAEVGEALEAAHHEDITLDPAGPGEEEVRAQPPPTSDPSELPPAISLPDQESAVQADASVQPPDGDQTSQ